MRAMGRLLLIAGLLASSGAGGEVNHLTDHDTHSDAGDMHAVIEIPAGTNAKWQVGEDGRLAWEEKDGRPRVVGYLPYPANYGMVPRTLQAEADGGDGDPLDVFVLGPALPRGSLVSTRPIAVIRMLDGGERDDKLLAVPPSGPMGELRSLAELEARHPGALRILRIWLENYKGSGEVRVEAVLGAEAAGSALAAAAAAFERVHGK